MDRINPVTTDRHDIIDRIRRQVSEGAYRPPVDELVNRLVSVVLARRTASPGNPR